MAVRQYVGARYVPKFFNGESGSTEWVNGLSYEPLTVVTYLGNSFTSKKPVPPEIGAPNENQDYWANTGNYNAQVEIYREETEKVKNDLNNYIVKNDETLNNYIIKNDEAINNLETQVSKINSEIIKDKEILGLIIGDSYTTHDPNSGGVTYTKNFGETLVELGYLTSQKSYGVNGARYALNSTSNFKQQLETASTDDSFNNDDVDIIIIEGGQNERFESDFSTSSFYNRLYSNVKDTIKYAKSMFKNAKIYCVPIFWDGYTQKAFDFKKIWDAIYNSACDNGAITDSTSLYWGRGTSYTWGTDHQHPTYDTLVKMCNKCGNLINGGKNVIDITNVCLPLTTFTQCKVVGYTLGRDSVDIALTGYNTTAIPYNTILAYVYPPYANNQTFCPGTISSTGENTAMFTVTIEDNRTGDIKCLKEIPAGERFYVVIRQEL